MRHFFSLMPTLIVYRVNGYVRNKDLLNTTYAFLISHRTQTSLEYYATFFKGGHYVTGG